MFAQSGTVTSVTIITDRQTGNSKGFGFVEMSSPQDGQKAIEQWNGASWENRTITVNEARERQPQDRDRRSNSGRSRY
jgi:RNA recognition motif-containing protein